MFSPLLLLAFILPPLSLKMFLLHPPYYLHHHCQQNPVLFSRSPISTFVFSIISPFLHVHTKSFPPCFLSSHSSSPSCYTSVMFMSLHCFTPTPPFTSLNPPPPHVLPSSSLSLQWQESPFLLYLVSPIAGCLAGRAVSSTAGQASSLDAAASSQWPWSAWTGTSRSAIWDTVCHNLT